jgi:three-Cys-motif partner protein
MARKKMDPFERVLKNVHTILDDGTIYNEAIGIENEYANHTLFKLTSFNYMQNIYCQVMKNQEWLKHCYYVDLMGGSGCTKIRDRSLYALGSPILAAINSNEMGRLFEKIICVEVEKQRAEALYSRLCAVYPKERVIVYNCAAEEIIPEIIQETSGKGCHSLVCVDYQNTQGPGFNDLIPLLNERRDIIITLMTQTLWRAFNYAKVRDFDPRSCEAMAKFFGNGCPQWKEATCQEYLEELYCNNIRSYDRRVETVKIQNEDCNFNFSTCFSCKNTKSDSPFMKGIVELNNFFHEKPDILKIVLDKVEHKITQLDDYL